MMAYGGAGYGRVMPMRMAWAAAWLVVLAGCHKGAVVPPAPIAVPHQGEAPSGLLRALEALGEDGLRNYPAFRKATAFSPSARKEALQRNGGVLARLRALVSTARPLGFASYDPFGDVPDGLGIDLLASLCEWQADVQLGEDPASSALSALDLAYLGRALREGDAASAVSGLNYESRAYRALARALPSCSPATLAKVGEALDGRLGKETGLREACAHEATQALLVLEHFRKLASKGDWDELARIVGPMAFGKLAAFRQAPGEADQTLRALAGDVQDRARWLAVAADQAAADRDGPPARKPGTAEALWRHAAAGIDAMLALRDRVEAERRIVRIQAWAMLEMRQTGALPADLGRAPQASRACPYSGMPLAYQATAAGPRVYSVGPDLRDDGKNADTDVVVDADPRY
jgi:hypothetical protein